MYLTRGQSDTENEFSDPPPFDTIKDCGVTFDANHLTDRSLDL
jgi:hypothetical protein